MFTECLSYALLKGLYSAKKCKTTLDLGPF